MQASLRGNQISRAWRVLVSDSAVTRSCALIARRQLPRGGDPNFRGVPGIPLSEGRKSGLGGQARVEAFAFANMANLRSTRPNAKLALSPTARVLLVYMALRALDEDSSSSQRARRSFMRRSELGLAIGRLITNDHRLRRMTAPTIVGSRRRGDQGALAS